MRKGSDRKRGADEQRSRGAGQEQMKCTNPWTPDRGHFPVPGSIVNLQFLPSAARCFVLGLVLTQGRGSLVAEPFLAKMHFDVVDYGGRRKEIWKNSRMLFGNPMDIVDSEFGWRQLLDGGGGGHGIHGISFCWGERLPNLTECTLRGDNWMGWKMRGRDVFGWVKMAGTRMANFPLCSLNQNCNKTKVMNRILAMAKIFLLPHSVGIYLSHILSLFSCGSCNLFNYFNGIFLLSICRYYGAFVAG